MPPESVIFSIREFNFWNGRDAQMHYCSFTVDDRAGFGLVDDREVIDLSQAPGLGGTDSLREAIATYGPAGLAAAAVSCPRRALAGVRLLPPVPDAERIICVGLNYRDHATEASIPIPKQPSLFVRFQSSFVGADGQIQVPNVSEQFDFEGEIALVIGKSGRHITQERARDHLLGLTIAADNSVRDWQVHSRQATPGKNFFASGAMGPWCTSIDEFPDLSSISLETRLNGETVQRGSSADLIFSPEFLIEYISTFTPLSVGDVILLGTPAGVGMARKPPLWMKPGDRLEISVAGIGNLAMDVVEEAAG